MNGKALSSGALVLAMLYATAPPPVHAQAVRSKSEIDVRCHAGQGSDGAGEAWGGGLHPSASGLTPTEIPGATRVTAAEAMCLVREYGKDGMAILTPIKEERLIPQTVQIVAGGRGGTLTDAYQDVVALQLRTAAARDRSKPLLIYCHNVNCFLSYNSVLRARQAGYRNLYWLRSGLDGWTKAGGTLWGDAEREAERQARMARSASEYAQRQALSDAEDAKREAQLAGLPHIELAKAYSVTKSTSRAQAGRSIYYFERKLLGKVGQRYRITIKSAPGQYPNHVRIRSLPGNVDAESTSSFNGKTFREVTSSVHTFRLNVDGEQLITVGQNAQSFSDDGAGGPRIEVADPAPYTIRVDRLE